MQILFGKPIIVPYEFGLLGNCKSLTVMDLEPEPPFMGGSGSREKGRLRVAPAPAPQHW